MTRWAKSQTFSTLVLVLPFVVGLAAVVGYSQNEHQATAVSGIQKTIQGTAEPHTATGPVYSQVEELRADQVSVVEPDVHVHPAEPVIGDAEAVRTPTDPPTSIKTAAQAATDFKVQVSHDLTEVASSLRSTIQEPSVASMGDTVFYAANWYAARSTNGGQTFSYVNPRTTFSSINNGFCCDQVVHYSRAQDMMLWALMYRKDSTTGTIRIARAVGAAAVAANTWTYYDFNPQMMGFASGNWFDFPNMTVSTNFLYVTANVYKTADDSFTGSAIWRIPLAELAAGGSINWNSFTRTDTGTTRCTEGATTTMYCGSSISTTKIRIFNWPDTNTSVTWNDISINAYTRLNNDGIAYSPDGTNWAGRADSRVLGAWVANGVIGFMWMAKQDASYPYPYTIIARFDQSTRARLTQTSIWNDSFAWLYPTASPNASGGVAGLLYYGGGSYYPSASYWIVDDVEPNFTPLSVHSAALSAAGPTRNAWGDYFTVRQHKDFPNTWVAAMHYMNAGGADANTVGRYAWFGRARDLQSTPAVVSISPAGGVAGTTVNATISGANLTGATAVTFSGSGVTATIGSGNTATALPVVISIASGAAAGTRTITVTTATGVSAPFSGFTVAPLPSVTSITPNQGVTGSAVAASISGTNLDGATAVTFSGSGVTATIGSGGTATSLPIVVSIQSSAATGLRTLTVRTAAGTSNSFSGFTITQRPRINSIFPAIGGPGSTVNATMLGANLTGASVVTFSGSGVTATIGTGGSSTLLPITVSIASGAEEGLRTATITTPNGTSDPYTGFYVTPTPLISSISPGTGGVGKTVNATIDGANLTGATAVSFTGTGVSATILSGGTSTSLPVSISIASGAIPGIRLVTVTAGAGVSQQFSGFRVAQTPSITSITPAVGSAATTINATIAGGNLDGATAVSFSGSGITATIGTGATATILPVKLTISSEAATGLRAVTVTTGAGPSDPFSGFTVTKVPIITGINPALGAPGTAVNATISGLNLSGASAVTFSGSGVTATIGTGASATSLPITINIASNAEPTEREITVTTSGGTSEEFSGFTVASVPSVSAISPDVGLVGSNVGATINGLNLSGASAVTFSGSGVIATIGSGGTASSLPLTITVDAGAAVGTRTLSVTTPFGTSAAFNGFRVARLPAITSITPDSGATGTTVNATVAGTDFEGATAVAFSGSGVTATIGSGATATTLPIRVAISSAASPGSRTVTVTTPAGDSVTSGSFTVTRSPVITSINPVIGAPGMTINGTVSGVNLSGASAVSFSGSGVTATIGSGGTATYIPISIKIAADAPRTVRTVTVTTPEATSAAFTGFTVADLPVINAISPSAASQGTSFSATITGTNLSGATHVTFNGSGVSATIGTGGSSTSLSVAVTVASNASIGVQSFAVTTAAGTSLPFSGLTVNPAITGTAPIINQLSGSPPGLNPSLVPLHSAPFTLSVSGQNFESTSRVNVAGALLDTTFVSANQLTAVVPKSLLGAAGSQPVTVVNSGALSASNAISVHISSSTPIGAYQLTIGYNKSVVALNAANVTGGTGNGFTGRPLVVNIDNAAGTVTLGHFQTTASPSGTFSVATLAFTPVAAGTSSLSVSGVVLTDTLSANVAMPPASVTLSSNTVSVAASGGSSNAVNFNVIERGDINASRVVNIGDALAAALTVGGITKPPLSVAVGDVNLSGSANIGDALMIALFAGGVTRNFPVPVITAVSPSAVSRLGTLTLTGTGFSTDASQNQVLFTTSGEGVVRVTPASSSPVQIVVAVPAEAVSGPIQVFRLDTPVGSGEYPIVVSGTTIPLSLTSIEPFYGVSTGSTITLTGLGFATTAAENVVTFRTANGTTTGVAAAATSTSLTVSVPAAAECGPVTVKSEGKTSNARILLINGSACPLILTDMYGGGSPGDTVVIQGVGFDVVAPRNNVLTFPASGGGTVTAPVLMAGRTELHVKIPDSAAAGDVKLTVGSQTSNSLTYGATSATTPSSISVVVSSSVPLGSYQVRIGFNKNIVTLNPANITGGNGAGFTGRPTTVNVDNDNGVVILNHFQVSNAPTGTFTVANLVFTPVATGTSDLNLTVDSVTDITSADLPRPPASVSLSSSSITVIRAP